MECGYISPSGIGGGIDLRATIESGQTFIWNREGGDMFREQASPNPWYSVALPHTATHTDEAEVVRVRERDNGLEWESTTDATLLLARLLRLTDNLNAIERAIATDNLRKRAFDAYHGLRVVRDPSFSTLISFICSSQMRVERIHQMQQLLAEEFGSKVEFNGATYNAYPTAEQLTEATEDDLRSLNLGYRAPYVKRTAQMVASGDGHPLDAVGLDYEDARNELQKFVGVGDKVADCVLLFSLGYLEAVPLDTWIESVIEQHYPACSKDSYKRTSAAIRDEFGGSLAGYAQNYVFHYARHNTDEV